MHGVSRCLYMFTRSNRFLAGSVIKMMNTQVIVIKRNDLSFSMWLSFLWNFRQRYVCLGWFKIIKNCKRQSIEKLHSLEHLTRGCCIVCVKVISWTCMWNISVMWLVVQRPDSTIHLQCNGRNGHWVYLRLKQICCQQLLTIRINLVARQTSCLAMKSQSHVQ